MNEWSHDIGNYFLNWFKVRFNTETKDNYIIFLGDIAEKDSNPGDVIDQMYKLFEFCNNHFKHTYVLMGNHDLKLFRGHTLQTSLKFLDNFTDVSVIYDISDLSLEGKNILCLPHLSTGELNPHNYYNNYDWEHSAFINKKYQLAIGHWIIKDEKDIRYRNGVDITRLPLDLEHSPIERGVLCGHIHNRPIRNYIGSVWPANKEELKCAYSRCFIKWSDTWEEEALPDFVKYETIDYGTELTHQTDCVHLYTIADAPSEGDAKRKYNTFFIKGVQTEKKNKATAAGTESTGLDTDLGMSDVDLLKAMIKERNLVVSRKALKMTIELLEKKDWKTN